jgi:SAM-dependent methyltransferase
LLLVGDEPSKHEIGGEGNSMISTDDAIGTYTPKNPTEATYTSGKYAARHPDWHVEDSPWRAAQILRLMRSNRLEPRTICEVGCGAGEILRQLQDKLNDECALFGYDISPQAIKLAQGRANKRLTFKLADIREERDVYFDLLLVICMLEHLEDIYGFLRDIRERSEYKIFQIPLELSVWAALRRGALEAPWRHGHRHFFTKEILFHILKDGDYDVLDYFYAGLGPQRPGRSLAGKLHGLARRVLFATFATNEDLAARVFGRNSIVILAR